MLQNPLIVQEKLEISILYSFSWFLNVGSIGEKKYCRDKNYLSKKLFFMIWGLQLRTSLIFDSLLAMAVWGISQLVLYMIFLLYKNDLDLSSSHEIGFCCVIQSFHALLETCKAHICKIGTDEMWRVSCISIVNLIYTKMKSCHFVSESYFLYFLFFFQWYKMVIVSGVNKGSLTLI